LDTLETYPAKVLRPIFEFSLCCLWLLNGCKDNGLVIEYLSQLVAFAFAVVVVIAVVVLLSQSLWKFPLL